MDIDVKNFIDRIKLDVDALPDLSFYYNHITKMASNGRNFIVETWGDVETYVNVLYWMRFVQKYDWYEMAELLNTNYINVRYLFDVFGWNNDSTFEESYNLLKENIKNINELIKNIEKSDFRNSPKYIEKRRNIKKGKVDYRIKRRYNVEMSSEHFDILYFLYIEKELPIGVIASYYYTSRDTIMCHLRKYNILRTRKEARELIEKKGRANHAKSRTSYQREVVRKALKQGISNDYELLFRDLMTSVSCKFFNENDYECIIGVHTTSIIPPKEIDVPVMVINKGSNEIYKYAIELSGNLWHKKERDDLKREQIKETNWKYIDIRFNKKVTSKNQVRIAFEQLVKEICEIIRKDIENIDNFKDIMVEGFK